MVFCVVVELSHIFYSGGGGFFNSKGIKIEGGRERTDEKGGRRGGEKEHLPFIYIAYFETSL
jgi:hypothetical protein